MSTTINVTVDDGGLPARNRQQTAANRQAFVQGQASQQAAQQGVDQRAADRRAAGLDPTTGRPLASAGTSSRMRRIDQEPAASRNIVTPTWGLGWLFIGRKNYYGFPYSAINIIEHGTTVCQVVSGNGKHSVTVEFESVMLSRGGPRIFCVPVRRDLFICAVTYQVYLFEGTPEPIYKAAVFLVGFDVVKEIQAPDKLSNLYADDARWNVVNFVADLDWENPAAFGDCAALAYKDPNYPNSTPGYIYGGGSLLEYMFNVGTETLQIARQTEPSPLLLDARVLNYGWTEQTCELPIEYLAGTVQETPSTVLSYPPPSYNIGKNGVINPLRTVYATDNGFVASKLSVIPSPFDVEIPEDEPDVGIKQTVTGYQWDWRTIKPNFEDDFPILVYYTSETPLFYDPDDTDIYLGTPTVETPPAGSNLGPFPTKGQVGRWAKKYIDQSWANFRAVYPNRPVYIALRIVNGGVASSRGIPTNFDGVVFEGWDNVYEKMGASSWPEPSTFVYTRNSIIQFNLADDERNASLAEFRETARASTRWLIPSDLWWYFGNSSTQINSILSEYQTNNMAADDWPRYLTRYTRVQDYIRRDETANRFYGLLSNSMNQDWTNDLIQYGFSSSDLAP